MIGGTIGYNWQVTHWVFGLEGDLDWTNINGTTNRGCFAGTVPDQEHLARHHPRSRRLRLRPVHALCHRRCSPSATSAPASPASAAIRKPTSAGPSAAVSSSPSPATGPPRPNISTSISATTTCGLACGNGAQSGRRALPHPHCPRRRQRQVLIAASASKNKAPDRPVRGFHLRKLYTLRRRRLGRVERRHPRGKVIEPFRQLRMLVTPGPGKAEIAIAEHAGDA